MFTCYNQAITMFLFFSSIFLIISAAASGLPSQQETPETRFDVTDLSNFPYTAILYNPITGVLYGCGVILNPYWLLTRARDALEVQADQDTTFMYQNIAAISDLRVSDVQHRAKIFEFHTSYTPGNIKYDVAMIKPCPGFSVPTLATVPPLNQPYNRDEIVDLLINYQAKMQHGDNKITDDHFCSDNIPNFDPAFHYCVHAYDVNSLQVFPVNEVLANTPLILHNNKFFGLVVAVSESAPQYATVLKVEKLNDWFITYFIFMRP